MQYASDRCTYLEFRDMENKPKKRKQETGGACPSERLRAIPSCAIHHLLLLDKEV